MSSPASFNDPPKSHYLEFCASALVGNAFLKVLTMGLGIALVGTNLMWYKHAQTLADRPPLIFGATESGALQPLDPKRVLYQPGESNIKYFLAQFTRDFYGRNRATFKEDYPRSLYFLDERLARSVVNGDANRKVLQSLLAGQSDEIEVRVISVELSDLRSQPYHATVVFEKLYFAQATHTENRRERYTANVQFVLKDHIPNELVLKNPLGLTITYMREDQAFEDKQS